MLSKRLNIVAVAGVVLALVCSSQASILSTDFDSLSTGAITAANLNSVTIGGSWTLGSYSTGDTPDDVLTHAIENDGGGASEKALSSKISGGGGLNPPWLTTSELDFTTAIDIDAGEAEFDFEVAQSKGTGFGRPVKYSFLDSTGAEILYFHVNDGNLYVNSGVNQGSVGGNGNNGLASWNSTSSLVWTGSVDIDTAGNVAWSFGGQSGATSIASTADIKTFQSNIDPDQWQGQGTYLNYFTADVVPEPATMSLLVLGGLGVLARRRRRA